MVDPITGGARGRLPRLLYIGDVPVEASLHGSALVHRLLQSFPKDGLLVVEGSVGRSLPARRLPGVQYRELPMGRERWLRTRFRRLVAAGFTLRASGLESRVERLLGSFQPEAVLTVAHGFSWLTAAAFAQGRMLPLHLIVHDDWPAASNLPGPISGWLGRRFGSAYRHAASRLCISPFMAEDFERRYGARGEVLYPSRTAGATAWEAPPGRVTDTGRPLVFAFGGTINSVDQVRSLRQLAEALDSISATLSIYGPFTSGDAKRAGLSRPNIRICGLVPSAEFISTMRAEADVLFVPMTFDRGVRSLAMTSFPSKLSDYTAAGLPLLIFAPRESSAVRWAEDNPGTAEVVDTDTGVGLEMAVRHLASDPSYRLELGRRALIVGREYFSDERAQQVLSRVLGRGFRE